MEYLARKSEERVVKRRRIEEPSSSQINAMEVDNDTSAEALNANVRY